MLWIVFFIKHAYCSLPVQSAGGEMVVAEATVKGKKKEAITQCALEVGQSVNLFLCIHI